MIVKLHANESFDDIEKLTIELNVSETISSEPLKKGKQKLNLVRTLITFNLNQLKFSFIVCFTTIVLLRASKDIILGSISGGGDACVTVLAGSPGTLMNGKL